VGIGIISLNLVLGPFEFICEKEERMFGELGKVTRFGLADIGHARRHVNHSVGSRLLGGFQEICSKLYCLEEWVVGSSSHSQERRLMG